MSRSIQQLPNNSGTTSVTEVYTSTGFNAGDPVYFQNGDYKNPTNLTAPSTVNFSFPETASINPSGLGGIVAPSFTYAQMQNGISGGTSRRFAAVLTSGNIVQAWTNYNAAPSTPNRIYFRIITPSNTIVISPTIVSATFLTSTYSNVCVVALVGGGFAVGWVNTSGGTTLCVNYAIYDNTGTAVTAATQDTSFAVAAAYLGVAMTKLANGGFAIAAHSNGTGTVLLRAYSSTGVGAYSVVNTGITANSTQNSIALTSRSDSTVFIGDITSTTQYAYAIYDTGGTAIVSSTFAVTTISSGNQGLPGPSASVLADGTTIVIGFNSTTSGGYACPAIRFLPTGNTLGAEIIAVPNDNLFYQTSYGGGYISVLCLSSNNFILYFADGYGNMQYAFYNSSGTCVSGSNGAGAIPIQVTGGFCGAYSEVTLLESSGYVYAYWTAATNQQKPVQQVFCKISTSNYTVLPFSSVVGSTFNVSGVPTGALIPSTVNPNSVSYYSTTSSAGVSTNTPAVVSGPTVVSSTTCDAIASCTLPNGNFVVAWRTNTVTYTVYAQVYSSSGSLLNTLTVGTSNQNVAFTVKVAALTSGGFVVAWANNAGNSLTMQVYNSSYSATSSLTISIYTFGTTYNFDMAGMTDDNFVLFYSTTGSVGAFVVYNSSLTALQTINVASNPQSFAVAGNSWGGFTGGTFRSGAGQGFIYAYNPSAANTWALSGTTSLGNMSAMIMNPQIVATESGMYIYTTYDSSSYPSYGMGTDSGSSSSPYIGGLSTNWPNGLGSTASPTSYPMMGIGMTGNGNVVIATSYDSANLGFACLPSQMTFSTGQQLPFETSSASNIPMFSNNAFSRASTVTGIASQVRVTSNIGNNAVITFINPSNFPAFLILNGTSLSNVYPIIAGVTPSALTPIAPVASSGVISGAFAGVAITSATAGSTGQLATNGQALLGASYTSTATGAFDSTGGAVGGLKGTFNGRSVNLQGNS